MSVVDDFLARYGYSWYNPAFKDDGYIDFSKYDKYFKAGCAYIYFGEFHIRNYYAMCPSLLSNYGGYTSYDSRMDSKLLNTIDENLEWIKKQEIDKMDLRVMDYNDDSYLTVNGNGYHRCSYLKLAYLIECGQNKHDLNKLKEIDENICYIFNALRYKLGSSKHL